MDIRIVVSRRRAILPDFGDYLVGDNKGDRILVEFDDEWDEYTVKTARFHYNGISEDVVFSGGEVEIPRLRNTSLLEVGFFAGDLRTSTPVQIRVKRSAIEKEGLPPDPTPDVYTQLTELIKSGSMGIDYRDTSLIGNDFDENEAYSEFSSSFGSNTKAGGKGYRIASVVTVPLNDGLQTYTLNTVDGLEVGMEICVKLASVNFKISKIESITGRDVTVSVDRTLEMDDETSPLIPANYLIVIGRPDLGDIDVGLNSFVVGLGNIAQDFTTFAGGRGNKAVQQYAFVVGRDNVGGYACFVAGRGNTVIGNCNAGFGRLNLITGEAAFGFGWQNIIRGLGAFGGGIENTIDGDGAFGVGSGNTIKGLGAFGGGLYNVVDGAGAASFGQINKSLAPCAFNGGYNGQVLAACGATFGSTNIVRVNNGFAAGYNNIAGGYAQFVIGVNCVEDANGRYVFIIGNGADGDHRSNAFTVDWNGNAWFAGSVEGTALYPKSPSGYRFLITVDDNGVLTTRKI